MLRVQLGSDATEAQVLVRYGLFFFFTAGLILFGVVLGYWSRQGREWAKGGLAMIEGLQSEVARLSVQKTTPVFVQMATPPQPPRKTYPPRTFRSAYAPEPTVELRALPQGPHDPRWQNIING